MGTKNAVGNSLTGSTGSGAFVGATSPTLVTPALGTPASGDLSNCTFPIATQANQETGTSTTTLVTPGRQQYHPSACKSWIKFNGTGTIAIIESYNVTSITDRGTGQYTVSFNVDFSSTGYAIAGCIQRTGDASAVSYDDATAMLVGDCYIEATNNLGFTDPNQVSLLAFGDQ